LIDHNEHNIPSEAGKVFARLSLRDQMAHYNISLDDPIFIPPGEEGKKLTQKELLLGRL